MNCRLLDTDRNRLFVLYFDACEEYVESTSEDDRFGESTGEATVLLIWLPLSGLPSGGTQNDLANRIGERPRIRSFAEGQLVTDSVRELLHIYLK